MHVVDEATIDLQKALQAQQKDSRVRDAELTALLQGQHELQSKLQKLQVSDWSGTWEGLSACISIKQGAFLLSSQ